MDKKFMTVAINDRKTYTALSAIPASSVLLTVAA